MKKHLYLMRHGQTLFNVRRKIQGWCDSPLTELGIKQALAAHHLVKDIHFDHYYSSTSERCCDTMELVMPNRSYVRLKGLRERFSGTFEGESEDLNPKSLEEFDALFPKFGGESIEQLKQRMWTTLNEIMNKEDHHCVFAVSSSGAMIVFASIMEGQNFINDAFQYGFPNCGIMHFEIEQDKWQLKEILKPEVK